MKKVKKIKDAYISSPYDYSNMVKLRNISQELIEALNGMSYDKTKDYARVLSVPIEITGNETEINHKK